MSEAGEVTRLLRSSRDGDREALDRLVALVYPELRRVAANALRRQGRAVTLQATAVIHEAWIRLADANVGWDDRVHFFAMAATVIRRILVDHARARHRLKRGGGALQVTLDEASAVQPERSIDIVALDEALERLSHQDERMARVVELHYFGGLTYDETAAALDISAATVDRELRLARAWLYRQLT